MIKYTLKCENGHHFDSWLQNSAAFEKLKAAGHLACAVCGSADVEKAIMAPRVNIPEQKPADDGHEDGAKKMSLSAPMSEMEQKIQSLRKEIEANSVDVGKDFANQARAMHYGEEPAKSIIGEATGSDAKELLSEGIPVAPLPWSTQKNN